MKTKITFLVFLIMAVFAVSNSLSATVTFTDFTSTGLILFGSDGTPAASTGAESGVAGVSMLGKTSSGVSVAANSNANGYSIATQHNNGSKAYATSYDSTSIYSQDATVGSVLEGSLSDTSSADFAAWDKQ